MKLVDTHAHIHFDDYGLDAGQTIADSASEGVDKIILVGCTLEDSSLGVQFVQNNIHCWASIGIHPHESVHYFDQFEKLSTFSALATKNRVVAIGECGLDYYYMHSDKQSQEAIFRYQIELAQRYELPMIFHVRDAFDDFFRIFDDYKGINGVVHSFSTDISILDKVLECGLYVGLNGIVTFTKSESQLAAVTAVPLDRLLLETDSPYLTPTPYRGTINEPKHIKCIADFLSRLRGESVEEIADATTKNAIKLFGI
jgi:TatD DNase family protein